MFDGIAEHEVAKLDYFFTKLLIFLFLIYFYLMI